MFFYDITRIFFLDLFEHIKYIFIMKKNLLFLIFILGPLLLWSQTEEIWKNSPYILSKEVIKNKRMIKTPRLYQLNLDALKKVVSNSPKKSNTKIKSNVVAAFPDENGQMQRFNIYQYSNFSPELEAQFPNIKSYYGESIEGKSSKIYFSISPLGFYSMQLRLGKEAVFIDTYDQDKTQYIVYKKSDKGNSKNKFSCNTTSNATESGLTLNQVFSADDATLRTYRLALSCTGEYAQYFGGTTANALAAMNNTITRVNGVFENDFAIKMVLIPNQNNIIFLNPATDPYSDAATGANGDWNTELMAVLHGTTYGIGDNTFDIGHLFGATGGGGSAGCIGCVCNNSVTFDPVEQWYWYKGQGYTSPIDDIPSGDSFDIDFVAHEIGHQFGANHTFTNSDEGTIAQVEPGSGSTIMGYAGITSEDVQPHSDPYFHAVSIQQVTNYIKSSSGGCSKNTATSNGTPTANAGADYTIPQNTPFMLTGSGSDPNGDNLTYAWEQMDVQNTSITNPSATKTSGPNFRSYTPSTSPVRYFPNMTSVLAGATKTMGPTTNNTTTPITVEILPTVSRTLKFRLTVRDNKPNGGANTFDDMVVTVNSSYGPLKITSQNTTGISYPQGSTQTITWNVANTNVLSSNVDLLLSTDGGTTWNTIISNTPNDGTQSITIPGTVTSNNCRFMVKASENIFFNVNTVNFTITLPDTQAPTAPTLSASGTTGNSTLLTWTGATDNIGISGYDLYQDGVLLASVSASPYSATGLTPNTTYVFTVKAKDASGNVSSSSNTVSVTTLPPDVQAPTAPLLSASGTSNVSTTLTWSGATDNVGITGYQIFQNGVLIATVTSSPYTVTGLSPSTLYSFTIKAIDAAGNTSPSSNEVSITTNAAPTASELYISEYLEGSSNNKVIEITNPTGSAISLTNYSIKKQANGSGSWVNEVFLSGTINSKSTYLIKNGSYALACSLGSAQSVAAAPMDFNGNDPIGLFKNGTLIDIVGTFNGGSANFAIDVDLRRKVIIPNTTYTPSEWDSFAVDTCNNLGIANPASLLSVEQTNNTSNLSIVPNPVKGDWLWVKNLKKQSDFEIIDISGKLVIKGKTVSGGINVKLLPAGIYFLKIDEIAKRFIKE